MVTDVTPVYADVKDYVECLLDEELDKLPSYDKWINDCCSWLRRFILLNNQTPSRGLDNWHRLAYNTSYI